MVAASVIVVGIAYLMFTGSTQATVYYFKLSELMAKPGSPTEDVRVAARVVPGTIRKDPSTMTVDFVMAEGGATLPVRYTGVVPDTFKDNSEVVLEGRMTPDRGLFRAHTLMAKCPSKYESQYNTEVGREHQKKYGMQTNFKSEPVK
jgi:cytochrome c-type biogenesis protein CcmE